MKTDKFKSALLGVFWVDVSSHKIYSEKITISQGQKYGENLLVFPGAHFDIWGRIRPLNPRWKANRNYENYEDVERGRVAAFMDNPKAPRFRIVMNSNLHTEKIKKALAVEFNLPYKSCDFLTDDHYEIPKY